MAKRAKRKTKPLHEQIVSQRQVVLRLENQLNEINQQIPQEIELMQKLYTDEIMEAVKTADVDMEKETSETRFIDYIKSYAEFKDTDTKKLSELVKAIKQNETSIDEVIDLIGGVHDEIEETQNNIKTEETDGAENEVEKEKTIY